VVNLGVCIGHWGGMSVESRGVGLRGGGSGLGGGGRGVAQVAVGDELKAFFDEKLGGEDGVVDVESQSRASGAKHEGIGVMDIEFGGQENGADGGEGLGEGGEFDDEEFLFGEGEEIVLEDVAGEIGVGADDSDERGIGLVVDGEGDDAAGGLLVGTDE